MLPLHLNGPIHGSAGGPLWTRRPPTCARLCSCGGCGCIHGQLAAEKETWTVFVDS